MEQFAGRVGILQRVLPPYRVPLFDALASVCRGGLNVCAGRPAAYETLPVADGLKVTPFIPIRNRHLLRGSLYLCWQSGAMDWLQTWQPDVLIAEANPRYPSTRVAIRWMHKHGRPVLGWGLGVLSLSEGLERVRAIGRRRFLRSFDGLIAYSTRAADQYASLGIPAERIFVAKNAATMKPSEPPPSRDQNPNSRPIVLFVGKLTDVKRVDLLIKACAALGTQFNPQLRIVGDGPALGDLKTLAQTIYPGTEFLGPIHGAALNPIFRGADLFVLPGLGGLAIQESMSHGLPVIVAEADGTQDDLVRPENGWNIPAGDLDALLAAMRQALQDRAKLRAMGIASYRIVAEEINIEKMVESFVRALNTICPSPASVRERTRSQHVPSK
jgi:glycosyltransferase involved in cell wall biosynthesis